jgi:predicted glycogen debranching enzyme
MIKLKAKLPQIQVEPQSLSDLDKAIQTEWIETNGLGGYASSTVLGINTRKYHGLLVAAFNPPVNRRVLLAKLDENLIINGKAYQTGSNEFKHGIQPRGYEFLSEFSLSPMPAFKYSVNGVQLQKTIFVPHGRNATIVSYEGYNPHEESVQIQIFPLVNSRHFQAVTNRDNINWSFLQNPLDRGAIIQPSIPMSTLILYATDGRYLVGEGAWTKEMYFRVDDSRGESSLDDAYQPGFFEVSLSPMETERFHILAIAGKNENEAQSVFSLIYSGKISDIEALFDSELKRRISLLEEFRRRHADLQMEDWLKWVLLAADSFIVDRESTKTKSVIAGYHWFEDWGRDSLISLSGLTLVTGRFEDAKQILLTFNHYCQKGIVPNRFPDSPEDKPVYNTVDATLWYFNAVLQYLKYASDFDFVQKELWDTLKSIVEYHVKGTMNDIRMDNDGLIAHGPQLTWMDTKIGDWIITPRDGKAVEIQALWYNALKTMEMLAINLNEKEEAEKYSSMAEMTKKSFVEKFWNPQKECLFDVVNGEQRDPSLRPNQIMAVALDFSMLDKAMEEKVVETVWRKLWGTYGLKTLSEDDPRYVRKYLGDWFHRDSAYHNGTVWAWLLGPFTTAFLKVKNYEKKWRIFAFENFLKPLFQIEVFQAGLGTISEIFDADPPHSPQGCISQAWSVAEPLRAYIEDVLLKRPHILSQK